MSSYKRRGVALILALSVIMLLSIALMKTFENRTVETVHLANSLQRFQSETLSRSIFRAILLTIKTKGLLFVQKNISQWEGASVEINQQQYFQIQKIQPLDHLFNLNRRFRADDNDPWPTVFLNIVNLHEQGKEDFPIEKTLDDITPILSAINDWIDIDDEPDDEFLYNNEEYNDANPEFEVKNRDLDRLTEVRLIPAMQELAFSQQELKEIFRIFPVEKDSNRISIDLNLSTPEQVEEFLEIFQDVEKFPNVYDARETISGIMEDQDNALDEEEGSEDLLDPDPRFKPPLYNRNESVWDKALSSAGIELDAEEQKLFSPITNLLAIEFSVTTQRVTVTTEAILEIEYTDPNKSLEIKKFYILQFAVH